MVLFPACKINLGLHILRKRADGFHALETVFYPLPLHDAVEVVQHSSPVTDVEYSASGLPVDGPLHNNICIKAYRLLKQDFPQLPAVKLHLHKSIPMGAGLGGGSADGAFTLLLLNRKFNLGLDEPALLQYALQLGSDCPFFIRNKPSLATGRGEELETLPLDLANYKFVVVNPGIHVATGWAFTQINPRENRPSLKTIIAQPVAEWKHSLTNDFEEAVFRQHPQVAECKAALYSAGAVYAAMTGSGSTVFGLFPKGQVPALSFPENYWVKIV